MIKTIFASIALSFRVLLRSWQVLIVLLLLYAAIIGAVYLFFATREATVGQLILSLSLALAAPVLFFVLQTMASRYISNNGHVRSLALGGLRDFWKLLVISVVPIVIIGLIVYLLAQINVTPDQTVSTSALPRPPAVKPSPAVQWQAIAVASIQYLLLCLVLPLALIHLWIAAAIGGLKSAVTGSGRALGRALAPASVLTYAIGFLFFGVAPYFLLFSRTEVSSTWLDIVFFAGRMALAVLVSLLGWVITVGALSTLTPEAGSAVTLNNGRNVIEGSDRAPVGS
jgi:hypothetical protein